MSRLTPTAFIVESEPPQICQLCGAFEECRPYGPGGKQICFTCMQKDEPLAQRQLRRRVQGLPPEPEGVAN